MIENSIQLRTKSSNELLFPITKSELVHFSDGSTLDEKLGNVSIDGAIIISKPIIACNEDTKFALGVTVYGELTAEEIESETSDDLILKSENGFYYKVIVLETGELETESTTIDEIITDETTEELVIPQVHIQTPEPHGLIFKIGVLDDGTLLTSPICDIDLIDDNNISTTTTWSSNKIYSYLQNVETGGGSSGNVSFSGSASDVTIEDASDLFTATNVEDALLENKTSILSLEEIVAALQQELNGQKARGVQIANSMLNKL